MWSIESFCSVSSVAKDSKLHITELLTLDKDAIVPQPGRENGSATEWLGRQI